MEDLLMNTIAAGADMSQQHVDAITLASWGFEIGPLNGKAPMTQRGFYDFTNNYTQINQWWTQWPAANIGARPPAYAVVLDVDVRSGGKDTWATLNEGHMLPHTLVTETGTGGLHVWFRLPYSGDLNKFAGQGIDIKHRGGYLVMPGSYHPTTGELYRCISWCDPARIPELPHHLRRHVFKPAKPIRPVIPPALVKKGNGDYLIHKVLDAQPGTRNESLNNALFQAYKFGYEHRIPELLDAGRTIGLADAEIDHTHRSAQLGAESSAA